MSDITDEMRETTSLAIMKEDACGYTIDGKHQLCGEDVCFCRNQADAAIEAVAPLIRAQVWREAAAICQAAEDNDFDGGSWGLADIMREKEVDD